MRLDFRRIIQSGVLLAGEGTRRATTFVGSVCGQAAECQVHGAEAMTEFDLSGRSAGLLSGESQVPPYPRSLVIETVELAREPAGLYRPGAGLQFTQASPPRKGS